MIRLFAFISGIFLTILPFNVFAQIKQVNKTPYLIDIAGNLKNHRVFKLSEIATDVSYVRLETRPDILLGYVSLKPAGKYFIVAPANKPIMLFTREGKYIRTIGSIGKGPGEYRDPSLNQVDTEKEELFVIGSGNDRILRYSFSGKLLQDIPLPYWCKAFYRFPNGNFLLSTSINYKTNGFYPFTLLDPTGKLLKEILSDEVPPGKRMAFATIPSFTPSGSGCAVVTNFGRDKVYEISPDGVMKTYAIFKLGPLRMPDGDYYDAAIHHQHPFDYAMILGCMEIGGLIRVMFFHEMHSDAGYFDPVSKTLAFRDSTAAGEEGFRNDLDGGPSIEGDRQEGNYIFSCLMAVDLKQSRQFYARQVAMNPERKKAMLEMIDALDENDNPVIMIVKLRSGV